MKQRVIRWDDICWRTVAAQVSRLQQKVFDAEQRGDSRAVRIFQNMIASSFSAKVLAVHRVAQISKGRNTAGIDGVKSLTPAQKLRMASSLTIHHQPSAVRRKWIPKPGKNEMRPLGIPNMIDRAHQALLVLIMEPQWEVHFSDHQYGFRKGRGTHDAIKFIQSHLRKAGPKWILEIDIKSFFDDINHEELLRRINAPPAIADAIRRCLKAGVFDQFEHAPLKVGTPQGGPLSPLLANIVLAGLEAHLKREFRRDYAGRITALGYPALVIYADDAVVMHRDRSVVEWSKATVQRYLDPLGLKLSESKTRITHTLDSTVPKERAGFDFLGFHVQHFWKKKSGKTKAPYILVTPSETSEKRFYQACAERIDKLKLSRKQRGARRDRQKRGAPDPVSNMIRDLNKRIVGWENYFCASNAKVCFSRLDHLLHRKLWKWSTRRFNRKPVQWIIDHLFSGVERDKDGMPLLRRDGNPRARKWAFKSPFVPNEVAHVTLRKMADRPIRRHTLVKPEKRFYDGDWTYWQLRMKYRYPGTPPMVSIAAFRRQNGKCSICSKRFCKGDTLIVAKQGKSQSINHLNCSSQSSAPAASNHTVDSSTGVLCKPSARKRARWVSAKRGP